MIPKPDFRKGGQFGVVLKVQGNTQILSKPITRRHIHPSEILRGNDVAGGLFNVPGKTYTDACHRSSAALRIRDQAFDFPGESRKKLEGPRQGFPGCVDFESSH